MNVLLAAPYGGVVGGISRWTQNLLDFYNKEGKGDCNIDLLPTGRSVVLKGGHFIYRFKMAFKDYRSILRNYNRKLKKEHYDVMHLCSTASVGLLRDIYMLKAAKKKGIKTSIHFHCGRIPYLYEKRNWEQKLLHRVMVLADKVIVIDRKSYDTLLELGYANVELLPNPLTSFVMDIVNENNTIKREDHKVMFAGHIVLTKGVYELVEACKQIPNISLKMIGRVTNDMREQMIVAAGEGYQSWLEIVGELPYEDTIKEMMSAGVFVLPTYSEGFPNVIIESMACGCPIVTTDVGAIPEMLDIDNGFNNGICVKPKDVEGLKRAIEKMLNDRDYAIACGRNAQNRVAELYLMPIVWKNINSIWKSILNN